MCDMSNFVVSGHGGWVVDCWTMLLGLMQVFSRGSKSTGLGVVNVLCVDDQPVILRIVKYVASAVQCSAVQCSAVQGSVPHCVYL